jgi:hypothetical protein
MRGWRETLLIHFRANLAYGPHFAVGIDRTCELQIE